MTGKFLSTPSARRATLFDRDQMGDELISIHALREEGDKATVKNLALDLVFLSTPSARRATLPRPPSMVS